MNPILARINISNNPPIIHSTPMDPVANRIKIHTTPRYDEVSRTPGYAPKPVWIDEANPGYSPKPDWLMDSGVFDMYIGPNAKGYDDLDPALHPEFSSLADRMRRKEISDEGSEFIKYPTMGSGETAKDIIKHKQLFKMYPKLAKIAVSESSDPNYTADYSNSGWGGTPLIRMNKKLVESGTDGPKSIMLHELQHAIQAEEDFARGGNSEQFSDQKQEAESLNQYLKSVEEILTTGRRLEDGSIRKGGVIYQEPDVLKQIDELKSRVNELSGKKLLTPKEQYNNLAGEVEARDTQSRMNMSLQDRLKHEPLASQGVSPKDMIVRRLKGGVANSMSNNRDLVFNGQPNQSQLNKINDKTHTVIEVDAKSIADAAEKDLIASGYGKTLKWDDKRASTLRKLPKDTIHEDMPELGLQNGAISINDGRHRLDYGRELGGRIRILVPTKDAKTLKGLFGSK